MAAHLLPRIEQLSPYVPGMSIDEIREKYHLERVIKLASNENPLGASPLAQNAIISNAARAFRYPQGGNPRLAKKLAQLNQADPRQIIIGNGSDEIIDLLIRVLAEPACDNIVCCRPCFSIYPIQAAICGVETRRVPLMADFSFDFGELLNQADPHTKLLFLTTPDNPSGYCPTHGQLADFASELAAHAPNCLLVLDEAYMDFAPGGLTQMSDLPQNAAILRTFSKSYGLAGMRIGYAILPHTIADGLWRVRLPFSVNILAEEAALAALEDTAFRQATLAAVAEGREMLTAALTELDCHVLPSAANFLMFSLPPPFRAQECFQFLLEKGIIIRPLKSYDLPEYLRVSVGNREENIAFLEAMAAYMHRNTQ